MSVEESSLKTDSNIPHYKRIAPRLISGVLHPQNKGALDWGWQGYLAYGCQSAVIVLDTSTYLAIQTLDKHQAPVIKVKWCKTSHYHDINNPYLPRLASSDTSGHIIVWDIRDGNMINNMADGNKPILDMEWVTSSDDSHHLLAALHPPYSVIVWNVETGTKLWKKSYTENLLSFAFDPFDSARVTFLCQDCILFVDDFTLSKVPSGNGHKFYILNPSAKSGSMTNLTSLSGTTSDRSTGAANPEDRSRTRDRLRRRMRFLVGVDTKPSRPEDCSVLNECLQLSYHKSYRNHLLLLYPRELLILDLDINQTVGVVNVERNALALSQVMTCRERDVIYCLHENASVTLRVRRKPATTGYNVEWASFNQGDTASITSVVEQNDLAYDSACQSDHIRLTRHSKVLGFTICPVSEKRLALLISDGRVVFQDLGLKNQISSPKLPSPLMGLRIQESHFTMRDSTEGAFPMTSSMSQPIMSLADLVPATVLGATDAPKVPHRLQFVITGMSVGVAAPPLVIRMCPPLTTKNWAIYRPLLAAGTALGSIQIINMSNGALEKELAVHTCSVGGIEWISLTSFISFAHPNVGNGSNKVKNELIVTDVPSGRTRALRTEEADSSPIDMIRVSCLKHYFIVAFKEDPFELWDLQNLTLLRTMPKKFPIITALEWSPSHTNKTLRHESMGPGSLDDPLPPNLVPALPLPGTITSRPESRGLVPPMKEHFVFSDVDGRMYKFTVDGNAIKDGTKIPPEGGSGSISCLTWKGDLLVLGDVDGNLSLWNLRTRITKAVSTHRGWIRKIRFAPGKGNMKLLALYNDGADVWDVKKIERLSQVRCPREMPKVQDIDWAASDRPVLSTQDGCIRIMDIGLRQSSSSLHEYDTEERVSGLVLLHSVLTLSLRSLMSDQSWRSCYDLDLSDTDGFVAEEMDKMHSYLCTLDSRCLAYLYQCPLGTAERCLMVSRLYGDECDLHFWTVALHYLNNKRSSSPAGEGGKDLLVLVTPGDGTGDGCTQQSPDHCTQPALSDQPLHSFYDLLCDTETYRSLQLERVGIHENKRATYEQSQQCACSLILLGQTDRAVQLLLETESNNDNYYVDSLRASLVASVGSSGAAQSTIKLVATNLIASGRIDEGVQLLCLINKGLDACRYLQSHGQWNRAAWLAKATLEPDDCLEVMRRWVDHLSSQNNNQKNKAVLVLLSLSQFVRVAELLLQMNQIERCALFIRACLEFNAVDNFGPLLETAYTSYARYLFSLGNTQAAKHYCHLAGDRGKEIWMEMDARLEQQ